MLGEVEIEREKERESMRKEKRMHFSSPLTYHGQDAPAKLQEGIGEDHVSVAAEIVESPGEGGKLVVSRHRFD